MGVNRMTSNPTRRPWARSAIDLADELSIPADLYHAAALLCGCWWMKNERGQCSTPDSRRISTWLVELGVISALQHSLLSESGHNSSVPASDCPINSHQTVNADTASVRLSAAREADIARVEAIVRMNADLLRERHSKWLFGDVLQLLWESVPARRVISERGILLADIRTGILRASAPSVRMFPESMTVGMAIGELKRLHKGRLAFLFVDAPEGQPARLITDERAVRRDRRIASRERSVDDLAVGRIAWVAVEESDNGRKSKKRHPAILLARTGRRSDKWIVLTMTTDVPGDPEARRVPGAERLGLEYGGYLWAATTKVYKSQVDNVVGWVHHDLVYVIDRSVGLRQSLRDELLAIADSHHPR